MSVGKLVLGNCMEYYNGHTNTCSQMLLLRVISTQPFLTVDVCAESVSVPNARLPKITFRPNRKSEELESAHLEAARLPIDTLFTAKVYLDPQYRKDKGLEGDKPWLCFLQSIPEPVSDSLPLISRYLNWQKPLPTNAPLNAGTAPPNISGTPPPRLLEPEVLLRLKNMEERIESLESELKHVKLENKRLNSRLNGFGYLVERRTQDVKRWVTDLMRP